MNDLAQDKKMKKHELKAIIKELKEKIDQLEKQVTSKDDSISYSNKDYIDGSAPDGFDTEECPLAQKYIEENKQRWIKEQIKVIIGGNDVYESNKIES